MPSAQRSSAASTRPGSRTRNATTRSRSASSSRIPTAGFSRRSRTGREKTPATPDRPAAARCRAVGRLLVVGAVVAAAVIALAVVALVRSGGSGDEAVQTVAGHEITRDDLELAVEHFHEEADREGRPFPASGPRALPRGNRRQYTPIGSKCNLLHLESEIASVEAS